MVPNVYRIVYLNIYPNVYGIVLQRR